MFSLVAIARKRPVYYKTVLKALLDFSPSVEMAKGRHTVSIQYSLRTAFLGFLRCTHPFMTEVKSILYCFFITSNCIIILFKASDQSLHTYIEFDNTHKSNICHASMHTDCFMYVFIYLSLRQLLCCIFHSLLWRSNAFRIS